MNIHLRRAASPGLARRAFTMVEMLVVIAVIILLVSITLVVGTSVIESAERRQTQATIDLIDMAYQEWRTLTDRRVRYGEEEHEGLLGPWDFYMDPNDDSDDVALSDMDRFMAIISRPDSVKDILARIDPSMIESISEEDHPDGFSTTRIFDAWDNPIILVHPGRDWGLLDTDESNFGDPDPDGTIRTPLENRLGYAVSQRPAFVSAGPSGDFGHRSEPIDSAEFEATRDNIYSYQLEQPQ